LSSHRTRVSDEALVAGMAAGDHAACTAFVHRFERSVFGLASLMLTDRGLAQDVAQQAFERAWRHAGSFDPRRGTVEVWLRTITRRLAIDVLRLRRPIPLNPADIFGLLAASREPDPATQAASNDYLARLRLELAQLPEGQQRAVVLAALGGCTTLEISELEGIPLGTAKTRLRTGLLRLRQELEKARADHE
jgi:RNA polymerase sigma factor (sigma-70 family)